MFTINTVEDLIQILDEHPQWVEALRARLLTRELIELPEKFTQFVAEMSKFVETTNKRLDAIENRKSTRQSRKPTRQGRRQHGGAQRCPRQKRRNRKRRLDCPRYGIYQSENLVPRKAHLSSSSPKCVGHSQKRTQEFLQSRHDRGSYGSGQRDLLYCRGSLLHGQWAGRAAGHPQRRVFDPVHRQTRSCGRRRRVQRRPDTEHHRIGRHILVSTRP